MIEELARFAHELADAARAVTAAPYAGAARSKAASGAFDPVTAADLEAERAMRDKIRVRFPDHSILGEEFGRSGSEAHPYCWSLDPIDGTRSFICGLPQWVTLVALLEEQLPVLGLIDVPRLDERYVAHSGTTLLSFQGRETRLQTSGCASLDEARLSTTDPFLFEQAEFEAFDRVRRTARITRFGLDGYAYAKLASGGLDLVIESGLKPHDLHALIPIVEGAGGTIGDWTGGRDFAGGAVVAAASRRLYEEAVALLAFQQAR